MSGDRFDHKVRSMSRWVTSIPDLYAFFDLVAQFDLHLLRIGVVLKAIDQGIENNRSRLPKCAPSLWTLPVPICNFSTRLSMSYGARNPSFCSFGHRPLFRETTKLFEGLKEKYKGSDLEFRLAMKDLLHIFVLDENVIGLYGCIARLGLFPE